MKQVLVRDLDDKTVARLKSQAQRHGRSLQGEVKVILMGAVDFSLREARAISERWQKRLVGHALSDSARLIREDRTR